MNFISIQICLLLSPYETYHTKCYTTNVLFRRVSPINLQLYYVTLFIWSQIKFKDRSIKNCKKLYIHDKKRNFNSLYGKNRLIPLKKFSIKKKKSINCTANYTLVLIYFLGDAVSIILVGITYWNMRWVEKQFFLHLIYKKNLLQNW